MEQKTSDRGYQGRGKRDGQVEREGRKRCREKERVALCEGKMKRRKGSDKDERRRGNMVKKKIERRNGE